MSWTWMPCSRASSARVACLVVHVPRPSSSTSQNRLRSVIRPYGRPSTWRAAPAKSWAPTARKSRVIGPSAVSGVFCMARLRAVYQTAAHARVLATLDAAGCGPLPEWSGAGTAGGQAQVREVNDDDVQGPDRAVRGRTHSLGYRARVRAAAHATRAHPPAAHGAGNGHRHDQPRLHGG